MNRRRSRPSVNRSQAGIRSRRRRLGALVTPRASDLPLHESSSEAQSAKTGSNPTAAHGLSAARLLKGAVFQFPQKLNMARLCRSAITGTPTFPQRTAPHVTAPASGLRLAPTAQVPRRAPQSLSFWSFGDFARVDRKSTRLNSSHGLLSRMPSSA